MTDCHLRKCNTLSLVRQIVLGLVAGILCFLVLSYASSSSRKNEPEAGVAAPTPADPGLPETGLGQASGAATTLGRPDEAGLPLPGVDGAIAGLVDGTVGEVTPMLAAPVSGALPSAADTVQAPKTLMRMSTDAAPLPAAKPSPAPKPQGKEPGKVGLTSASVLNQKNGNHLSVQLMGSGRLDAIAQFVFANQLAGKVWIYRTSFHGSPWYVVLKGDHAGMSQALAAIRKLPPALQKAGPWPKSFAQVKRELKQ